MPSKNAIFNDLDEISDRFKKYSSVDTFTYGYDKQANEIYVNYKGFGFPAKIESLMNRDDATVATLSIDGPVTIQIEIGAGSSVKTILNEISQLEKKVSQCSSTDTFNYSHNDYLSNVVRIVYSGDGFADEIEELLTRDDSMICAFYGDEPLTVNTVITPRRLPHHD